MMFRFSFLFSFLFVVTLWGSIADIDKRITHNKQKIENVKERKSNIDKNIAYLADRINKEQSDFNEIVDVLEKTNNQLLLNKVKLSSAKSKVQILQKKAEKLEKIKEKTEQDVIDFVIEKYAMNMGIEQAGKESLKDVIAKETYTLIFDNVKDQITDLNIQYLKVNKSIRDNERKIRHIDLFIKKQNAIQVKYENLVAAHEKTLNSLKDKHKLYQESLQRLVDKQNEITDLLGSLNILKKEEIHKEEERIKREKEREQKEALAKKRAEKRARALLKKKELARQKALAKLNKQATKALKSKVIDARLPKEENMKPTKELALDRKQLDDDINIEVKKIGSSAKGIKISKYNGRRTIAPLKSYVVTKKFGKYYDKVYKMELFNESVSLKTKRPNAKVFSIFKGQVVYAKQNSGLLENVVIVKHQNNLHTIYSHLDKIAPTLKVGKWIPKGYVVGRVSDTLEFQATKNSKYIDPLKLIQK